MQTKSKLVKSNQQIHISVMLQNFEHTVHVGFDAITGEFTVSSHLCDFFWILLSVSVCRNENIKQTFHLLTLSFSFRF